MHLYYVTSKRCLRRTEKVIQQSCIERDREGGDLRRSIKPLSGTAVAGQLGKFRQSRHRPSSAIGFGIDTRDDQVLHVYGNR